MNYFFSIPSVPTAPPGRESSRTRRERWHDWVSDLRLYGVALGPVKEPLHVTVAVNARVRWPREGNPLSETIRAAHEVGIVSGLKLARIVDTEHLLRVRMEWKLVPLKEQGCDIEITTVLRGGDA